MYRYNQAKGMVLSLVSFAMFTVTGCTQYVESNGLLSRWSSPKLLLCENEHSCVNVKIIPHASTAHTVALQIRMTHMHHHYDIQRVSFDNGQKMLTYMPIQQSMRALGQGQYLSFTTISVPANLIQQLPGPRLKMDIYTDRGVIKRYLAVDGQYAPLYIELADRKIIR